MKHVIKLIIVTPILLFASMCAFLTAVMDSDRCRNCGQFNSTRYGSRTVCRSCAEYRGNF